MKCYFHAQEIHTSDSNEKGVVAFAIPDIGVVYRAVASGDQLTREYAAVLRLLEFIDTNTEILSNQKLEILGDSALVVYQLSGRIPVSSSHVPLFRQVQRFRARLSYDVSWVPSSLNRAAMGLPDLPPLPLKFNFEFADHRAAKSRPASGSTRPFTKV
jgi:hypothetical protein